MSTNPLLLAFRVPSSVEGIFYWFFGILVGLGVGLPHNHRFVALALNYSAFGLLPLTASAQAGSKRVPF